MGIWPRVTPLRLKQWLSNKCQDEYFGDGAASYKVLRNGHQVFVCDTDDAPIEEFVMQGAQSD